MCTIHTQPTTCMSTHTKKHTNVYNAHAQTTNHIHVRMRTQTHQCLQHAGNQPHTHLWIRMQTNTCIYTHTNKHMLVHVHTMYLVYPISWLSSLTNGDRPIRLRPWLVQWFNSYRCFGWPFYNFPFPHCVRCSDWSIYSFLCFCFCCCWFLWVF